MKILSSLSAKYIALSLIVLAFIFGLVGTTFYLTTHMEGEARKINLAGRQRLHVLQIAMYMHALDLSPQDLPAGERQRLHDRIHAAADTFEEVLLGLRDGSESHGLRPIHANDSESRNRLLELIELWENTQKPVLAELLAQEDTLPAFTRPHNCISCHAAFQDHLQGIDELMISLESHSAEELQLFIRTRLWALVALAFIAIGMVRFVRKKLISPIRELEQAAGKIKEGDFKISLPPPGDGELGALTRTFESMAATMGSLLREKEESLRHLLMLHRLGTIASQSLEMEYLLGRVLREILTMESLCLEDRGAIFLFDEQKQMLSLAASRNFSADHSRVCGSVPSGECLCGLAARERRTVRSMDSRVDSGHTRRYEGGQPHGHLILPLQARERVLGVLCLYLPAGRWFSEGEEELLHSCADIIAMALQNSLNHRRLAMLAQALESSPDLVIITNPAGTIIHVNPRVEDLLGYRAGDIRDRHLSTVLSAAGLDAPEVQLVALTLAGGWEGELLAGRADGSGFPALVNTAPVRDELSGEVVALIVIVRDITERNQAEAALQMSEARFRALVEKSSDLIWEVNEEAVYTYISPKVETMLGYPAEEVLGRTPFDLMPVEEAARVGAVFTPLAAARRPFAGLINASRHRNGGLVVLETSGEPFFDETGQWRGYRGIDRDITERIRAERRKEQEDGRLRASLHLDRMPEGDEQAILDFILEEEVGLTESRYGFIGWVSEDETVVRVSTWSREVQPACAISQSPPQFHVSTGGLWAEPLRTRAPVVVNDYDRDERRQAPPPGHLGLKRFLGVPVFQGERIVMLAAVANKEEEYNKGDALTLSALLADAWRVIQRHRARAEVRRHNEELEQTVANRTSELEQARQLAEAASRAKSEFLANMSHELRTPLNAVMGFAEIIRDEMAGPVTPAQREYLGDILESGEHLLSLINDILDLAKVEAGQQELEFSTFMIADLVAHSLTLFREKALNHSIALTCEISPEAGAVTADERKLKQVLVNLLANALKFTEEGGRVQVSAAREGDQVRISVADTGIGIAGEDISRLFQPFLQLESPLTRKYPGTGLGLNLCRKLVELHGGKIGVESELGAGSCFFFLIPAQPPCSLSTSAAEPDGGNPLSATSVLQWPAGRRHFERLFSLQRRLGVTFALLRFRFSGELPGETLMTAAALVQQNAREHDLVMTDPTHQDLYLVLVSPEERMLPEISARFAGFLEKAGYRFQRTQVCSPRDGESFEELALALDQWKGNDQQARRQKR